MITVLSLAIIALAILAAWHFFYEFAFAPLFRSELKADARELQIRMARAQKKHRDELTERQRRLFRDSMSSLQHVVYAGELSLLIRFRNRLHEDKEFCKAIEARVAEIDSVGIEELRQLEDQADLVALHAVRANTAGWLVFVVPILAIGAVLGRLQAGVKRILAAPEIEIEKLSPNCPI